jgi:transcriptional regulator with XRE-family HTH domain
MSSLKEIRESQALSMRDLSKKSGVSPNTIFRIEKGMPSRFISRRKLAQALKVRPADIEWIQKDHSLDFLCKS